MGALVMIVIAVGVFLLLNSVLHWALALIGSLVFFVGWFLLNIQSSTKGLASANLSAYFTGISKGLSHPEALERMIATRYPFSAAKRESVLRHVAAVAGESPPDEQVKAVIFAMFCQENGVPPEDVANRMWKTIEGEYSHIASRYGVSA